MTGSIPDPRAEALRRELQFDKTTIQLILEAIDAADEASGVRRVPDAEIAELREHWKTAATCHAMAVDRYGAVCADVMQSIADGKPLDNLLQIIGDSMNACDHVDDDLIELWQRAHTVALAADSPVGSVS